jgi:hypothetical protein
MTEHARYPFSLTTSSSGTRPNAHLEPLATAPPSSATVMWRYGIFSGSTLRTDCSEVLATRTKSVLAAEFLGAGKYDDKG